MRCLPQSERELLQSGGVLIEATLVVALMSLLLFGLLQLSRFYMAQELLDYAAMNGARAHAVGLNAFMVQKVVRVSTIPSAGRMVTPQQPTRAAHGMDWQQAPAGRLWDRAVRATPSSPQAALERQRIPFYLAAENYGRMAAILDYEDWHTVTHRIDYPDAYELRVHVQQRVPVNFPMSRAFIGGDHVRLQSGLSGARQFEHSALYLQ